MRHQLIYKNVTLDIVHKDAKKPGISEIKFSGEPMAVSKSHIEFLQHSKPILNRNEMTLQTEKKEGTIIIKPSKNTQKSEEYLHNVVERFIISNFSEIQFPTDEANAAISKEYWQTAIHLAGGDLSSLHDEMEKLTSHFANTTRM
ncbi:hypothetical protein [Legionella maceachernii]|uniref:Uncharacterized protein n=1 Tax=Legionella maceachernii TaxID=466 RepID=A0A0W0WAK8_9GAMM|nr:hypothetical protein [Legionella maceachernii]KTD29399.1 hypothetical protein Lmac_0909 [Legionella maceachernii]SJZ95667.1 hypothetical protein SAMN02745128_01591 [Legionella maceachernii]SUP03259.1 Uncharacterised protein [Legionella maceachernii]